MKLYVGARDYRPEGYRTVDIDPAQNPDVVANIIDMPDLGDGICSEIVASHVLEHMEWPDSFGAMAEFSRILRLGGTLKIAVPDADLLTGMMKDGDNPFFVVGLLFGVGGRTNKFEQHRFAFNASMLSQILGVLGFKIVGWWNSPMPDASNGWCNSSSGGRVAISLNLEAEKISSPVIDPRRLYEVLLNNPLSDFFGNVSSLMVDAKKTDVDLFQLNPRLFQLVHFKLIEAQQRVKYLETEMLKYQNAASS